jgi:hypothetical protein
MMRVDIDSHGDGTVAKSVLYILGVFTFGK